MIDNDTLKINGSKFKRLYYNLEIETNYFISKFGEVYSIKSKKFIKCQLNSKGYYKLTIHANGKTYVSNLHRCVATVWKPKGFSKLKDVDHLDGNKENNKSSNLEWVTRKTNIKRAYKTGLKIGLSGDNAPSTKYSDASVRTAFEIISNGGNIYEASKASNIPVSYLYTMLRKEIRKDIFDEFDFKNAKILHTKRLSKKEKKSIQQMYRAGFTAKEVSEYFNVPVNTIYGFCKHKK